jgi:hypothetical protein
MLDNLPERILIICKFKKLQKESVSRSGFGF